MYRVTPLEGISPLGWDVTVETRDDRDPTWRPEGESVPCI